MDPKIVRDRIPEIIGASGKTPVYQTVTKEQAVAGLEQKLQEELDEYLADHSLEEMADLLEVMHGILFQRGIAWEELEAVRLKKLQDRGGFLDRILLEKVESK